MRQMRQSAYFKTIFELDTHLGIVARHSWHNRKHIVDTSCLQTRYNRRKTRGSLRNTRRMIITATFEAHEWNNDLPWQHWTQLVTFALKWALRVEAVLVGFTLVRLALINICNNTYCNKPCKNAPQKHSSLAVNLLGSTRGRLQWSLR